MIWSKQFYYYDVPVWLHGDSTQPPPPASRRRGRHFEWRHLNNADILSMPDKWEYPWYAAWDLAFHCLPLALIDADFAKDQLLLLTREWYMHPNGQLQAYEWASVTSIRRFMPGPPGGCSRSTASSAAIRAIWTFWSVYYTN